MGVPSPVSRPHASPSGRSRRDGGARTRTLLHPKQVHVQSCYAPMLPPATIKQTSSTMQETVAPIRMAAAIHHTHRLDTGASRSTSGSPGCGMGSVTTLTLHMQTAPTEGLEPSTLRLEGASSVPLSYVGKMIPPTDVFFDCSGGGMPAARAASLRSSSVRPSR
jgi:hypothetical protein